jgi:hypothetical protein
VAANAICARRNGELAAIPVSSVSLHAVAVAARRRAKIELRALGELERLTPTGAQSASYRQLMALDRAALLGAVKVGERAQAKDAAGVRAARDKARAGSLRMLFVASRVKLRECSAIPRLE